MLIWHVTFIHRLPSTSNKGFINVIVTLFNIAFTLTLFLNS